MENEAHALPSDPAEPALQLFEDFIRTREEPQPPGPDAYLQRLPDDESKRTFSLLVDSFGWTQAKLPRNVQPNVVLAQRFRLIEKLGAGGMGQVWRAEDLKLSREVAVKVLSVVGAQSIDVDVAFRRETELLTKLDHPGIVSVIDFDEDEEHRFLVMDLVPGRSLEEILERCVRAQRQAPKEPLTGRHLIDAIGYEVPAGRKAVASDGNWHRTVAAVMAEVLMTLEAAHARSIVHRDIKPGNIMLTGGGHPVLLDFGLGGTTVGESGDLTSRLFGTYRFVAPEQLRDAQSGRDPRTDIYQMGVVLYEFLTLRRAFDSDRTFLLFEAVSNGRFELPRSVDPAIPRELQAIVLKAMELDPNRRYATAEEFRLDLERFGRGEPVEANVGGRAAEASRAARYWVRQHRTVLAVVALVLLTAALSWGAWGWMNPVIAMELRKAQIVENRCELTVESDRPRFVLAALRVTDANGEDFVLPARLRPAGEGVASSEYLEIEKGVTDISMAPLGKSGLAAFPGGVQVCLLTTESIHRRKELAEALKRIAGKAAADGAAVPFAAAERILNTAWRSGESLQIGDREFFSRSGWLSKDESARLITVPARK